jgi:hypothetical protein
MDQRRFAGAPRQIDHGVEQKGLIRHVVQMAAFAGEKRRSGVKKPTLACKRTTFGPCKICGLHGLPKSCRRGLYRAHLATLELD